MESQYKVIVNDVLDTEEYNYITSFSLRVMNNDYGEDDLPLIQKALLKKNIRRIVVSMVIDNQIVEQFFYFDSNKEYQTEICQNENGDVFVMISTENDLIDIYSDLFDMNRDEICEELFNRCCYFIIDDHS